MTRPLLGSHHRRTKGEARTKAPKRIRSSLSHTSMPATDSPPNAFKQTEIGLIPEEWSLEMIGDLADIKYGKANPKSSGGFPVVGSGGIYAWTHTPLVAYPTLVIGRKGTAGSVQLFEHGCYPADTTFYLDWKTEVNVRFLYFYLFANPLSGEHAKTTLPSLQRPDLENLAVPLPPLPEQRAIAHVLSKIQAAAEAQAAIAGRARELKRALMAKLFTEGVPSFHSGREPLKETEIGVMPEGWEVAILNDVCLKIVDCPHTTPNFKSSGILVIRNMNVRNGRLVLAPAFYTSEDEYQERIKRLEPQEGDVLFSREAPIGEACLVPPNTKLSLGQRMMLFRTNQSKLNSVFLVQSFYSPNVRPRMLALGTGVTAQHLNVGDVRRLKIPLPPIEEQREIARILQVADAKIASAERKRAGLEELFRAMLGQLMTGRVRVKGVL